MFMFLILIVIDGARSRRMGINLDQDADIPQI